MPELSEKQRKITELRDCNILVSAAAGSGKTSVLVTRILKRITDDTNPIDIDRILVLTFTRAAAGSLRSRIAEGIAGLIEKRPDDERLKRQAGLIYNAQISTIDSFCLNILRNNFTEIGLEPGFRVADPKEIRLLEDEALDETVEEVLHGVTSDEGSEVKDIEEFLEQFESKDSLRKIRETIRDMYTEADKAPFMEDFIEERRSDYAVTDVKDIEESQWFAEYMKSIRECFADALEKNRQMREFCETNGPAKYLEVCDSDREVIMRLSAAADYESVRSAYEGLSWMQLPRLTKEETEQGSKIEAAALRKSYKDLINNTKENVEYPLDIQAEYMKKTGRALNALLDIVWLYHLRLTEKKKDKGIWTFSDVEHMALKILLKKEAGAYVPTQVALDYRNVYRELMIDEYQDSNRIQEWLIHSISGEDDGIFDRFIVGDVKQSIYRFRNADPTLFMEKYYEYTPDEGERTRIDLSMNYRSRRQVLNTVNAVFEKVMDREIGGVDYDEANRLYYGGVFGDEEDEPDDQKDVHKSELLVLSYDSESRLNKYEQEAKLIAMRIRKLMAEQKIFNKETKEFRECRYSDIVILMRTIPREIEDMRHILEANNIPVHTPSKGGYFDTNEIVTILNMLKILNNPHDDIALFGTLKSVFGCFDENEISLISLAGDDLYQGLKNMAAFCNGDGEVPGEGITSDRLSNADPELVEHVAEKAAGFLEEYGNLRDMVPYTPVYKLIRLIYDRYDYVEYVSAMPAGSQRKANVLALLSKAESYNTNGFGGIFDFCRYIDRLKKYESDEGEVLTLGENEDVVRIMTMHKSKGLEFPVCILAGLHKQFNMSDSSAQIVFDDRYGMGIDHVDAKKRIKLKCIRKRFIADRIKRESISEEMRVLYVAMTRAEEKLIMSAVIDPNRKDEAEKNENPHDIGARMKIRSFYNILKMTKGDNDWDGQCDLCLYDLADIESEEVGATAGEGIRRETFTEKMTSVSPQDIELANELKNKIVFKYPHKNLENLYTKTSVSELKMAAIHDGLLKGEKYDIPDQFFKLHTEETYVPSFARANDLTANIGAAIGSAVHRVMELIDYTVSGPFTVDTLDEQMQAHLASGALSDSDYALVNKSKVAAFVNSDIGARMRKAAAEGRLYKEKPFVLGISADRLDKAFPEDETVLIQGIIDVFFIEDDHIVLLDYKTDSIKTGDELVNRYKTQMDYYEEALRRIMGTDVSERILYSFALEEAVNC